MAKKLFSLALVLCIILSFSVSSAVAVDEDDDILPFELRKAFTHSDFSFDSSLGDDFECVMVFNPNSCDVLYQKNESARFVCGGSIAMLMTSHIALKYLGKNAKVVISQELENMSFGDSVVNLEKGQSYLACELIAAMLLYGAEDAAAAISAEFAVISGRIGKGATLEEKLAVAVEMMNEEAQRLMMYQTIYTNAYGKTDNDQRTSAEDVVRIMYALYNEPYSSYVGDTEELIGNVTQSGIVGQYSLYDPRNVDSPQFSREICGYGYYNDGNITVMALSQAVPWRVSRSSTIDGRVFVVTATDVVSSTIMGALNLMTYSASNYDMLYANSASANSKSMVDAMLSSTSCTHCTGTLLSHASTCEYKASELVFKSDKMPLSVDVSMFAVLTEIYTNNSFDTFSAVIDDSTVVNGDNLLKGDYYATARIYYQEDREFISVDLYVNATQADVEGKTYIVTEPEVDDEEGLSWQTIVILAIGAPMLCWVFYTVVSARIRRRKY